MDILALPVLLDPLGSGAMGLFVLAWLEALGLTALSIGATCLFVFTGARPRRAYYAVAIACFGLSHGALLRHGLEWWRGAMLEMPFDRTAHPITKALPVLSVLALFLIASAPSLRKQRDGRPPVDGSRARDQSSVP
jgi:hypothetical protein